MRRQKLVQEATAALMARPVLKLAMERVCMLSVAEEQIQRLEPETPERNQVLGYLDACQRRILREAGVHEEYVTMLVDSAAKVSARTGR